MNRIFLTLLLVIVTILMNLMSANAVTLHWGSAVGDFIYESDGTTLVNDSYNFELGTFEPGFAPTVNNLDQWANNWHVLDVGGYSSSNGFFAGSVSLSADPTPDGTITDGNATGGDTADFFFGKDAYVWIYNDNTTIDNTLEWNLLTNPTGDGDPDTAWTFPTAAEADARAVDAFRISDDGVTPVFGRENQGTPSDGAGTNAEGDVPLLPTGSYALQTFTIPEPSSAILIFTSLLAFCFRRNRS